MRGIVTRLFNKNLKNSSAFTFYSRYKWTINVNYKKQDDYRQIFCRQTVEGWLRTLRLEINKN